MFKKLSLILKYLKPKIQIKFYLITIKLKKTQIFLFFSPENSFERSSFSGNILTPHPGARETNCVGRGERERTGEVISCLTTHNSRGKRAILR